MVISIFKAELPQPERAILRLGYAKHIDKNTRQISFVRRLERGLFFPRFHLYVEDKGDTWHLNLHLDQRAPIYSGVTAHSGEYDGEVVEAELKRIASALRV